MAACHPLVIIPSLAFQGLDCPGPCQLPAFLVEVAPMLPSQVLSPMLHLYRGHGPLHLTAPSLFRFLPEPPSHGSWRPCLCPALHSANPEVGSKKTGEREPPFSPFLPFHAVHPFSFP